MVRAGEREEEHRVWIEFLLSYEGTAGGMAPPDFRRISSVHPITEVNNETEERVSVRHP